MWYIFLKQWNCVSFFYDTFTTNAADFELYTDAASTLGFGDVPERSAGSRCTSHDLSALLTRNVELTNSVSCLLKTSIAPRTRTQYECGYSAYATFLRMTGVIWLNSDMPPLTEESLIHFATHCFKNLHLKCSTIKMYICGIRYKYLENGKTSIFSDSSDKLYRLDALYRGIKKNEKKSTKPRLPITFTILKDICQFLRKGYYTPYVDILLEAACVTAYFGFLRCGEFTVLHSFDSECNVSIEDIRFLKDKVTFHLKASKTDPFREGVDIHLFASGASVCPVFVQSYLWNVTWTIVLGNSKIVNHKTLSL
ncbi:unnamed protein product [Mytilus edulis]|uniref:Uncharacterized protein n=1 Tax=Mytilus edulis TaxID=6550 RepID=A0A8S3T2Q4_MYTED|nr:unnamed protein product [Mytilus edulis]